VAAVTDRPTAERPADVTPVRAALAGAVAAAVALGTSELVSALGSSLPRLVPAVGDRVVDATPGDASQAAIDAFGTADKPLLITGIVVLSLVFGAVLGRLTLHHRAAGPAGFVAFGLVGVWAATGAVGASTLGAIVVAAVSVAAGVATLAVLLAAADGRLATWWHRLLGTGRVRPPRPADTHAADTHDADTHAADTHDADGHAADPHGADDTLPDRPAAPVEWPTDPSSSRRAFLGAAGVATLTAGAAALGGRVLRGRSSVQEARSAITLPVAARSPEPPIPAGFDLDGLAPLRTPNDTFYRIDTALTLPQVDPAGWRLRLDGLVDEPFELTYDELSSLPLVERSVTLACVSNEVGGRLVGNATWLGVPLRDLLDRAGVRPEAEQVVGRSVDGFSAGFPLELVTDDRPVLVAIGMNGEPLPVKHGFPARLVVAGLYGYVSATKWLDRIELATWEGVDGYWIPRGWSKEGPIKTQSRIDVPVAGRTLTAGAQPIAGVAWAPHRGIDRVEVRIDDGPWQEAELSDTVGDNTWRQWLLRWDAPPGEHRITVRATDGTGEVQTHQRTDPPPDGATGRHSVAVTVA
jgi:DMSO/TMAO reductase YedYZ molybdopterin-dependent catalytic subunit